MEKHQATQKVQPVVVSHNLHLLMHCLFKSFGAANWWDLRSTSRRAANSAPIEKVSQFLCGSTGSRETQIKEALSGFPGKQTKTVKKMFPLSEHWLVPKTFFCTRIADLHRSLAKTSISQPCMWPLLRLSKLQTHLVHYGMCMQHRSFAIECYVHQNATPHSFAMYSSKETEFGMQYEWKMSKTLWVRGI